MSTPAFDERARVERMLRGLSEAPRHLGLSFRGNTAASGTPDPGQTVVSQWLVPTSTDPLVATSNRAIGRLYAITGSSAADVRLFSAYPQEAEVVYLPGTIFVMGPSELVEGVDVTYVDQADPGRDPLLAEQFAVSRVREVVERLLRTMRERAPVDLPHPDKFLGDLG